MKWILTIAMLSLTIHVSAQDSFIKKATDECCECFSKGGKINQDSVFLSCSISAVSNNFFGLLGELSQKYADNPEFDIEKEMVKHFIKCRPIRKYYFKKRKEEKKNGSS